MTAYPHPSVFFLLFHEKGCLVSCVTRVCAYASVRRVTCPRLSEDVQLERVTKPRRVGVLCERVPDARRAWCGGGKKEENIIIMERSSCGHRENSRSAFKSADWLIYPGAN